MLAVAIGTTCGHDATEAAVVALKALAGTGQAGIFGGRLVVGECDGAVLALQLLPAGTADDGERVAAAVEQDERLLTAIESLACLVDEGAGEELLLARLLKLA